jgi:hypothetical protein
MIVDHYYKIGDTHDECQDYAISRIWDNGLAFTCIADGCSSSHDRCRSVDVGARILALSAEHVLKGLTKNKRRIAHLKEFFFDKRSHGNLGDLIILFAKNTIDHLMDEEDSEYALDSTLLITIADEENALVFVFGDGIVAIEYEDGSKSYYEVDYSKGAPYYLSYLNNPSRQKLFGKLEQEMTISGIEDPENTELDVCISPKEDRLDLFHHWSSSYVEGYKRISIMSDGFGSFEDADKNPVGSGVVVKEATNFKNSVGSFLQRRMKTMMRKYDKKEIGHYDDISIATIMKVPDILVTPDTLEVIDVTEN